MCWRSGHRLPVADQAFPWSDSRVRQMNSTPAEFRRALTQAFGAAVAEVADGLLLTADDSQLHFALTNEPSRQIGALRLDALRVEISVRAGPESAAKKLLVRVDQATQRGGG
jgi:hypothetical protein